MSWRNSHQHRGCGISDAIPPFLCEELSHVVANPVELVVSGGGELVEQAVVGDEASGVSQATAQ